MVNITFAITRSGVRVATLQRAWYSGDAYWQTYPPPNIYPPTANVPPDNPWYNVKGRTGVANIQVGGSVEMIYQVLSEEPSTITITVQGIAGDPGDPAHPSVQSQVAGGNAVCTNYVSRSGDDFNIAINFK